MDQSEEPNNHDFKDLSATDLSVGEILRRGRKHYGQTLSEVSSALRIRTKQLEALEKSEWHRLPGQVYTIGFVRAYAEYLGLDGEKMVRLLKMQSDGFTRLRPKLGFPAPPSESRTPGWKSLALAFLMAVSAIYVWETYLVSQPVSDTDSVVGNNMNRQPVSLSEIALKDNMVSINDIPIISPDTPDERISEEINKNNNIYNSTDNLSTLSTAHENADQNDKNVENVRHSDATDTSGQVVDKSIKTATRKLISGGLKNKSSDTENVDNNIVSNVGHDEGNREQQLPTGSAISNDKVALMSTQSTWIQIKDINGDEVFTRVLRPGDKYIVPADKDVLNLTTGNAGGLTIIIDGREIGPLGAHGDIIRGIELSPKVLSQKAQSRGTRQ